MDNSTHAHLEWWKFLTEEERNSLTDQFHEKYELNIDKPLSSGEIRVVWNRRTEYDY